MGLVQEDVVVHQVAQLGVNDPERKGQGLRKATERANSSCLREE